MNKERKYYEDDPISLREERRRTGRYIAVALAMCITLLGLYQAMLQHTPVVAGLFAPAIIMFLYIFWVLHTAYKPPRYRLPPEEEGEEEAKEETVEKVETLCKCEHIHNKPKVEQQDLLAEVIVEPSSSDKTPILPKAVNIHKEDNISVEKFTRSKLNRTYSIA